MNKINFTAKENFPLSSDTMDLMQQMINLLSKTAVIGGDNYILSGCIDDGTGNISDGVIVIDGEVLPFEGGAKVAKIKIQETSKTLTAFGENYPEAYVYRVAKFDAAGDLEWDDFTRIITNAELDAHFKTIKGEPVGVMYMWPGPTSSIPDKYMLCDGRELLRDDYPELFDIIDTTYGTTSANNFKLPDLRGRFVAGYDNAQNDYNAMGETGGEEKHTLTIDEIPSHSHKYERYAIGSVDRGRYSFQGNHDNDANDSFDTSTVGGGASHENRPPYIVLAHIIKVKP